MSSTRRIVLAILAVLALGAVAAALWQGPQGGESGPVSPADVAGAWGDSAPGEPYLELTEDGQATGNDGCNHLGGTYTVAADGTLHFHEMVGTLMACEGVDQWLRSLDTAAVEGSTLVVFDPSGEEIGRLPRA